MMFAFNFVFAALLGAFQFAPETMLVLRQSDDRPASIEESLDSMGALPWYNPESRSVEAVPVKPRMGDSINRESRWLPKPPKPKATTAPTTPATAPVNGRTAFWDLIRSFSGTVWWVIIGGIALSIVITLVLLFNRMQDLSGDEGISSKRAPRGELDESDQARLENLPVEVKRTKGDLLSEAERLRSDGRLSEAIIYLFGHRLLQLDRAHLIRLTRGKTNRQYLNELRQRPPIRALMLDTVELFEQSYFGSYQISAAQFDRIWAQQTELDQSLAALREAA